MDKIKLRQICFYFACVAPSVKFIVYPATLTYEAGNDLLLAALGSFLAQGLVLAAVFWLSSRTDKTFFALLQGAFGKAAARAVYGAFALYFLFSALLPMLEQRSFVMQVLYENVPSVLSYAPFFAVSAFACSKGFKALGRAADLALPLFCTAFAALIALAVPEADFGALLPVARRGAGIFRGGLFGLNWHAECAYPLFFLGRFERNKGDAAKVLLCFAAGAAAVLLFLAVFYGVFEDIAVLRQNSIAHISKYTTAFTSLGRIDLLFIFAMTLVNVFALCVPVQMCVHCTHAALPRCGRLWPALAASGALLAAVLLLNYSFLEMQQLVTQRLWAVFLLFAYAVPLAAALLFGLREGKARPAPRRRAPQSRRKRSPRSHRGREQARRIHPRKCRGRERARRLHTEKHLRQKRAHLHTEKRARARYARQGAPARGGREEGA